MSCDTKPGLASNPPHLLAPPAIGQGLHHPLGAILFPGTPGSCFRRPPPAHGPCCSSASGPAPSPGRLPAALRRQRQAEALPAAMGLSSHGSGQPLRLGRHGLCPADAMGAVLPHSLPRACAHPRALPQRCVCAVPTPPCSWLAAT